MKILLKMMLIMSGLVLVGCGGGGGIPSETSNVSVLEYKGKTQLATLDNETIKEFIENTNMSFADMIEVPDAEDISLSKKLSKIVQKSEKKANGSKSGSIDYEETTIDNVTKKITVIFKNFNDGDEETLDGKIVYLITVDEQESFFIKKMDLTIENFSIKDNEVDLIMHGTMKMRSNDNATKKTLTQNIVAKNNADDSMIKLENFITVLDGSDRAISYKGKLYDSQKGYIEVTTPVELSYDKEGTLEVGGEILYEGKNATVRERIAHDNSLRVETDYDKDGSVDEVEVYNAETLEIIPNRAPVVTIYFPQSIYTDTNMSEVKVDVYDPDLDEVTVAYEWKINGESKVDSLSLDNGLFVKHDMLKLEVTATDDRVGDVKVSMQDKEQVVLNTAPIALIESNATAENIEAFVKVKLDASLSADIDNDILTYQWKVYKYIPETEWHGEPIVETVWTDIAETVGDIDIPYIIIEVNASKYINNVTLEKPIFSAIAEGKHIILCTVFDDDMAENTTELNLTIKPLDIIKGTESKVFFEGQDTLGEWTFNSTIKAFDLNNDNNKELVYLTRNPMEPSTTLLHITHDAKNSNQVTQSHSVNVLNSSSLDFSEFNGDGRVDILLGGMNKDYVMIQNNDGTFKNPIEVNRSIRGIYIDDFNGDGKGDVVELYGCELIINAPYSNYNEDALLRYTVNACDEGSYKNSNILKVADFNNDGIQDFMVMTPNTYNGKAKFVIVYRDNNNDLVEGPVVEIKQRVGTNISIADLTRDGFNDIVFDFILFENNKDLTFKKIVTFGTKENGSTNDRIVIADINNDVKEDILYHNADILRVLVQGDNYQMGDFEIKSVIDNTVIADIDNDGRAEIIENYQNRIEITSLQ